MRGPRRHQLEARPGPGSPPSPGRVLVLLGAAPLGRVFDRGGPLPWVVLAAVAVVGALCAPRRGPSVRTPAAP